MGRQKKLRLTPSWLPVIRDHLVVEGRRQGESGIQRRTPDHRYIVRGFYRNQQYGPRNSLRRRQWIPPFVKGPEGAPLIVKDSVRIWRRL